MRNRVATILVIFLTINCSNWQIYCNLNLCLCLVLGVGGLAPLSPLATLLCTACCTTCCLTTSRRQIEVVEYRSFLFGVVHVNWRCSMSTDCLGLSFVYAGVTGKLSGQQRWNFPGECETSSVEHWRWEVGNGYPWSILRFGTPGICNFQSLIWGRAAITVL